MYVVCVVGVCVYVRWCVCGVGVVICGVCAVCIMCLCCVCIVCVHVRWSVVCGICICAVCVLCVCM